MPTTNVSYYVAAKGSDARIKWAVTRDEDDPKGITVTVQPAELLTDQLVCKVHKERAEGSHNLWLPAKLEWAGSPFPGAVRMGQLMTQALEIAVQEARVLDEEHPAISAFMLGQYLETR